MCRLGDHISRRVVRSAAVILPILLVIVYTSGCSTSRFAVGSVMVQVLDNSRDAAFESNDTKTFRDAAPANLFLIEGLVRTDPKNKELRLNAAMLYFAYAFSFVEEQDPGYASLLYQKGFEHGRVALAKNEKLPASWDIPFNDFEAALPGLRKKDVPAAVWTAVNWAQFINLHLDSTAVLRDIPKVTSLLERVAELDGEYFNGLVYVLIGSLHSFKPPIMGGDPIKSLDNFEKSFAISGDSFLLSKYFYARFYAYRIQDADAFEKYLGDVITAEIPPSDPYQLLNLIAKDKSRTLLGELDELF
jgi:hypothetical protein